ncbi:hypothetical protein ACFFNY_31050 [Paenibacillus hodogayensis]|uniref:Uncharacterized protein n=1 Tax=Paenibacillus hodogayensis TaxID=279208 RepID=A0ABV5W781_9BACL
MRKLEEAKIRSAGSNHSFAILLVSLGLTPRHSRSPFAFSVPTRVGPSGSGAIFLSDIPEGGMRR